MYLAVPKAMQLPLDVHLLDKCIEVCYNWCIINSKREAFMKARRKRTVTPIWLDNDLRERLREISGREDLSMSHLMRKYIKEGLHRDLGPAIVEEKQPTKMAVRR